MFCLFFVLPACSRLAASFFILSVVAFVVVDTIAISFLSLAFFFAQVGSALTGNLRFRSRLASWSCAGRSPVNMSLLADEDEYEELLSRRHARNAVASIHYLSD